MTIRDRIQTYLKTSIENLELELEENEIQIEVPKQDGHGDYASNVAFRLTKQVGKSPYEVGNMIVQEAVKLTDKDGDIDFVEVAKNGFINFSLSTLFFANELSTVHKEGERYGYGDQFSKQKTIVEFTDPNPFKVFHIGHLMSNAIGESISRIVDFNGAEVKRANYQGDVGLHVAKSIYGMCELLAEEKQELGDKEELSLPEKVEWLGKAYAYGATKHPLEHEAQMAIEKINKEIYSRENDETNTYYDTGRTWSLDYFETVYERLGTQFDYYFFESNEGKRGLEAVKENMQEGLFEESNGAIIFAGESHGLHNRVFINSLDLPTYEAKELGLAQSKHDTYPYDRSVIVTGNEIEAYFQVLLKAMSFVYPGLSEKTEHVAHGMLRLKTGKMSSRTGDVIGAVQLIDEVTEKVQERISQSDRDLSDTEKTEVIESVSVGAVKYSILKQSPGKDIVFDFEESLSLDGNSGPYLQYTYARARSILRKAGIADDYTFKINDLDEAETSVAKQLSQFPKVVEDAGRTLTPSTVCTYLFNVAQAFNSFYNSNQIIDSGERENARILLTAATAQVLQTGLNLLGIKTVERM